MSGTKSGAALVRAGAGMRGLVRVKNMVRMPRGVQVYLLERAEKDVGAA